MHTKTATEDRTAREKLTRIYLKCDAARAALSAADAAYDAARDAYVNAHTEYAILAAAAIAAGAVLKATE